jgi:hypothetical protein
MKKYITEETSQELIALMAKFDNSPEPIQTAIQFAKECFPKLDITSFGPGGYPRNNQNNCIKFTSQNPANSAYPIGYLCDNNNGPLVYLTPAEDDKKSKGGTANPSKKTTWTCAALTDYVTGYLTPELKKVSEALKASPAFRGKLFDYTKYTYSEALNQGFSLISLDEIYNDNRAIMDSISKSIGWQYNKTNKPTYFWIKDVVGDFNVRIPQEYEDALTAKGYTKGKCGPMESNCVTINLMDKYPEQFKVPVYYHYNGTNAEDVRTKLKSDRKETQAAYGKRDCKKVFKEYVDLISTCAQGKSQEDIDILKPDVQACINTQRENFPEQVRIIDNPIKGKHTTMSCTIEFRLNKNESHSRLKNIIRENLIKLSIRKGLI